MFYYLDGIVTVIEPNLAVVDCAGIGFACHTTTYTLSQLSIGKKYKLYIYPSIREDGFDLYGFSSQEEHSLFKLLIGVNGVGPKAALSILSTAAPDKLSAAIANGDEKLLTAAPGIGKKTAQRVVLELKDKVAAFGVAGYETAEPKAQNGRRSADAEAALMVLGYQRGDIARVLKNIDTESLELEDIIRQALKQLAG